MGSHDLSFWKSDKSHISLMACTKHNLYYNDFKLENIDSENILKIVTFVFLFIHLFSL